MKAFLALLVLVQIFATTGAAQESFMVTPNRDRAEGGRQATQLQEEISRNLAHEVSINAAESNIVNTSNTLVAVANSIGIISSTLAADLGSLRSQITVSLTSAGDVSCGNQGMLMGPSHTIAVGNCVPALTVNSAGNTILSGPLRLGSVGNCDASISGMLRYQSAQKSVQFCDGTSWQEVGATPALSGPFNAVANAEPSTVITSNNTSLTGFAGERTATVTPGATIVVNGTAIGAAANVKVGDTIALRVASSSSFDSAANVNFTVSSLVANWSVTTRSQDTTPNSFTFTNLTNQAVSTTVMSDVVTVAGFDGPLSVSISGQGSPQIQIAGGSWVASGSINPGQTLRARMTTSSSFNTAHGVTVSLGTLSTNWTATTNSGACDLPWGGTINHGQSVTAFQAACGTCTSESRTCSGGVLSGTFTNQSCASECNCLYAYQGGCATGPNPGPGSLIAAATDAPPQNWGSWGIFRELENMTNGFANTQALATSFGDSAHPAAKYCWDLVSGGFSDWYLPASDELDQLYGARALIGGFSAGSSYWSSTEYTTYDAWYQNFGHGFRNASPKTISRRVRCARRAN
jgi:hypothetical protein